MGILMMNIQSFSMIEAAYMNPTAYGDLRRANFWVWIASHVFFDQKFMTLFSLLFGAGIVLLSEKNRLSGRSPPGLHYRRMLWLFVIGMAHAHLFWFGDILVTYALTGCIVFLLRNLRPVWLATAGFVAISVPSLLFMALGATIPYWPAEAIQDARQDWAPDASTVAQELEIYRGGWLGQLAHRVPMSLLVQTFLLVFFSAWRAGGVMLFGMALLKWSVLSGGKPVRVYASLIGLGVLIGFPLILTGIRLNFQADWSLRYSLFFGSQWNYWGSLAVALSYAAVVCLWQKGRWLLFIRNMLARIGKTALTNYLLQTLICTTLFYGHGFGLYGRLERWQQALVVVGVWAVQILFTEFWLRRYDQGPFEYLWRSLTYWHLRPIPRASG